MPAPAARRTWSCSGGAASWRTCWRTTRRRPGSSAASGKARGGMNYERHVFAGLYEDVQRYCGSWWHRNRAALRRKYFGSPWSAVSFVVAALVVALTATQTYFTVFPSSWS